MKLGTLHLTRLQARQDEAQWVRSPEECKARIAELQKEIDKTEKELESIHP